MPKVHSVTVSLDGDKHVYGAGEQVSGQWTLSLGDSFSVKGVRVALQGAAYTRWEDDFDIRKDDKIGYEKFTGQWKTVFGTKLGENGPNHMLTAGEHKYRFSFRLPRDGLPTSYEGKFGAIRYWLLLQIDRPLFRFNIERVKGITVLDKQDVNDAEFSKPVARKVQKTVKKVLVVGNEGDVSLDAQTNRGAFCPGEKIALKLTASNDSERDLGNVKASLIQQVKFYASGDEKVKDTVLRTVTGKPLEKGGKRTWNGQTITLDALPPSTKPRACHIINVSYFVKVYVDIPKLHGGDATVYLPITVGTIPQGYKPPQQEAGASNIEVIDSSSAITYTECNAGFERFEQGESGKFRKFMYTPWCAYVPNFKFPVTTTTAAKPKATATPKPTAKTPQVAEAADALSLIPNASAPAPKVPSAPPAELPPSYDDVMSGLADIPKERPKDDSSMDIKSPGSATSPASKKGVYLLLRFPDSYVSVFRTRLVEFGAGMYAKKGSLVALAPQVIVTEGPWPCRMSMAVFVFDARDCAVEWFTGFKDSCSLQGLVFTDAIITEATREHENEKSVFYLAVMSPPPDNNWKSPEVRECTHLTSQLVGTLRPTFDGVRLIASVRIEHLCGTWPSDKHVLALSQWPSVLNLYKFKQELRTDDKYKRMMELRKKLFKHESDVLFQTEDLSFIEDTQSVAANEHNSQDTRKEEI